MVVGWICLGASTQRVICGLLSLLGVDRRWRLFRASPICPANSNCSASGELDDSSERGGWTIAGLGPWCGHQTR
ncbi:hypothetical protein FA13DRAFT_1193713 [Coprinellus micaceus]|uniref:Secreted protein n=1 Tax=Coprinellus micaceus TaxID=71717 RepID=A0A4Y7RBN3_COPMI|nr:hypothetical protein FA13DRAFT_1193713 [Coprinellus micaceus]